MAMDLGGKGLRSEINVTPLVDVMLVLLIIFMVVTPMLQRGKSVLLPEVSRRKFKCTRGTPTGRRRWRTRRPMVRSSRDSDACRMDTGGRWNSRSRGRTT